MRAFIIPLLALLIISSCSSSNKNTSLEEESVSSESTATTNHGKSSELEGEEIPISSIPSETTGFVVISNQRYDFEIDVPAHWQALDLSDDGDGFVVQVPENEAVEIRVYGEKYDELLQAFYEEDCTELAEFNFSNQELGKRCIGENEVSYWLLQQEHKLNVYIKGWNELSLAQKTNLTTMVKSLRAKEVQTEV